jgi:hypothetical protein
LICGDRLYLEFGIDVGTFFVSLVEFLRDPRRLDTFDVFFSYRNCLLAVVIGDCEPVGVMFSLIRNEFLLELEMRLAVIAREL